MAYRHYNKKYVEKMLRDPLPQLKEDERIYLDVTYASRAFAQYCHCGFDRERKLWFTGVGNANLGPLVELYGVRGETSEKASGLLEAALEKRGDSTCGPKDDDA